MNRQVSSCTLSAFMCASTAVDGQLNFIDFRQEVNICYEQLFSKCRFVQLRAQTRQQTDSWILLHFGRKPSNVMNSSSNFQVSVVCFSVNINGPKRTLGLYCMSAGSQPRLQNSSKTSKCMLSAAFRKHKRQ